MFKNSLYHSFRHKNLSRDFRILSIISKKSESEKYASTVKAIKNLNEENKYLFGELLDRPRSKLQKPKLRSNITSAEGVPLDGIQFEILRQRLSRINSVILKDVNAKLDETASVEKEISKQACVVSERVNMKQTGMKDTRYLSSDSPGAEKIASFSLPDIIVRNIKGFPLFNKEIEGGTRKLYFDGILTLSRHDTKFTEYPSVTRILNATMSDASKAALDAWKQRKVGELGVQGFEEYQQNLLLHGSQFHETIESYLSGKVDLEVCPEIQGCWNSLASVVPEISNVKVVESHVVHSIMMYRGVIDCVADYKGKMMIIDWKKSDTQKPALWNTYDAPLQVAAYLGAMNHDPNYQFKVSAGLVVVAYTDGSPCHSFQLSRNDLMRYWSLWLTRLRQYWIQRNRMIAIQNRAQMQEFSEESLVS